jgi:hypothetical protein
VKLLEDAIRDAIAFEDSFANWARFAGLAIGDWIELQALGDRNYYAHTNDLTRVTSLQSHRSVQSASGLYIIANQINDAVVSRSEPNLWHFAKRDLSTTNQDIIARNAVFIDVDAVRPSGTSATDEEMACATGLARTVYERLATVLGGTDSLGYGHSGNGRQIFLALNKIQESPELASTIKGILEAISAAHTAPGAKIDTGVHDAKRLVPLFGSMKRKGVAGSTERPHRPTGFMCSENVRRLELGELRKLLEQLGAGRKLSSKPQSGTAKAHNDTFKQANDAACRPANDSPFKQANEVAILEVAEWLGIVEDGAIRCPGCGNISGTGIVENGFKCFHNTCQSKGVPGCEGFRTPVDLVVETRCVSPRDAVNLISERFGLQSEIGMAMSAEQALAQWNNQTSKTSGLQRICDVLGADAVDDPRPVMPFGFLLEPGSSGEVSLVREFRKKAKAKECEKCGQVNSVQAPQCECGAPLPEEAPDEITHWPLARVALWPIGELVRPSDEGNLIELCAIVDGRKRNIVLPRGLIHDARKLIQAIEGAGIPLVTSKTLHNNMADYVSASLYTNRLWLPRWNARATTGWDADKRSFLLGYECIGNATDKLHLPAATGGHSMLTAVACHGEPEAWKAAATEFLSESPAGAVVLAAAVASPMLRLFGWAPVGMILSSEGGGGKSTIIRLGLSVFGSTGEQASRQVEGLAGNGNATLLALPGQFANLEDLPHFADEVKINTRDSRALTEIEAALHALVDGQGRAGMRRDYQLRKVPKCHGCVVLATETDTVEFLRKTGVNRRYMPARGPYVADPVSRPLGRFNAVLCENYGHAGRALIERLVASSTAERTEMSRLRDQYDSALQEDLTTEQLENESIRTWRSQIAVACAAVHIACELCPLFFPDREVWLDRVLMFWAGLVQEVGGSAERADAAMAAWLQVCAWIAKNRMNLQPSVKRERALANPASEFASGQLQRKTWIGRVVEAEDEDSSDEHILCVDILQNALTDEVARLGYSAATLSRTWFEHGWLEPTESQARKKEYARISRVGGVSSSVYRLRLGNG